MSEAANHRPPHGWAIATLGEISSDRVEQRGPASASDNAFVYVDISSIDNETKQIVKPKRLNVENAPTRARQNLRPRDVVVSMTRPNLNSVAIVGEELDGAVGSTGFHVLRSSGVNPRWLFYMVQTQPFISAITAVRLKYFLAV